MKKQRYWLLAAALGLSLTAQTAHSASITVDAGGICTLADAITAANTDMAEGGCPSGSGADIITLAADVTLAAALPQIASTITIEGGWHFISGNNDANVGSVLHISYAGGNLTLNETTIKGGNAAGFGGGIYNNGATVTLINSTVSGNTASSSSLGYSYGGGILNGGTVTLINSTVSGNTASFSSYGGGGGIYNWSIVTLHSSIISGNLSYNGNEINNNGIEVTADAITVNVNHK